MHSVLKREINSAIGWFDSKCMIFSQTKTKSNHLHLCTTYSYLRYTYKWRNCRSKHQVEKVHECTNIDVYLHENCRVSLYKTEIVHPYLCFECLSIGVCTLSMGLIWTLEYSLQTPLKMQSEILKTYWAASIQYLHMWAAIVITFLVLYLFNFKISV